MGDLGYYVAENFVVYRCHWTCNSADRQGIYKDLDGKIFSIIFTSRDKKEIILKEIDYDVGRLIELTRDNFQYGL
jgi:hypothetical protein